MELEGFEPSVSAGSIVGFPVRPTYQPLSCTPMKPDRCAGHGVSHPGGTRTHVLYDVNVAILPLIYGMVAEAGFERRDHRAMALGIVSPDGLEPSLPG